MMRQRKDELKRKRGALELNSDLDLDVQERRSELPSGVSLSNDVGSFKSKLHEQIRRQEREAKEAKVRDYMVKQDKNERVRNYAKNVKDLYMPGKGKRPTISQGQGLSDNEANINSYAEERKAYLATEADQHAQK